MRKSEIYLWGFPKSDLLNWPSDLNPIPVVELPQAGPVVVHAKAVRAFQDRLASLSAGRLPDAVLYLPDGVQPPQDAWAYFDAVVRAGDWDSLRALAACPRQYRMAEMAEELPAAFLAGMDRPIGAYRPTELPLPEQVRIHLRECATCRQAFDQAVEDRQRWRRLLLCPTAEQLAAFVRGATEPWVTEHVRACRFCQAGLRALQRELATVWMPLPLDRLGQQAIAALKAAFEPSWQRAVEVLATLMRGCEKAGLQPALASVDTSATKTAVRVRREAAGQRRWDLAEMVEQLSSKGGLRLTRPPRYLTVNWDAQNETVCFADLHDQTSRPLQAFRLEVCRGEDVLWRGESQAGRLLIPLAALSQALEAGADQVVIRALAEPE